MTTNRRRPRQNLERVDMAEKPKLQDEMPKAYEPGKIEQKWDRFWLE